MKTRRYSPSSASSFFPKLSVAVVTDLRSPSGSFFVLPQPPSASASSIILPQPHDGAGEQIVLPQPHDHPPSALSSVLPFFPNFNLPWLCDGASSLSPLRLPPPLFDNNVLHFFNPPQSPMNTIKFDPLLKAPTQRKIPRKCQI